MISHQYSLTKLHINHCYKSGHEHHTKIKTELLHLQKLCDRSADGEKRVTLQLNTMSAVPSVGGVHRLSVQHREELE